MAKLLDYKPLTETHPEYPKFCIQNMENRISQIWIVNYPTLNCQLFSIGGAYNLSDEKDRLENQLLTIKSIVGNKTLLLVDLKDNVLEKFKSNMSKYVEKIIETPYISTNGNKMIICLVYLNEKYLNLKKDDNK